jgi:hypothetical protein
MEWRGVPRVGSLTTKPVSDYFHIGGEALRREQTGDRSRTRRPAFASDGSDHETLLEPKARALKARELEAVRSFVYPVRTRLLRAHVLQGPLTATEAARSQAIS